MRVPLHEIIRASLRDRILGGDLAAGDPLPSEAELSVQFGASRGPVRQAITALSAEGLIETSQGRVPVVSRAPLAQSIDDFFSFSVWVNAIGRTPGQRTVELALRHPSPWVAAQLGVAESDQVVELMRVRSIDGEVVMLERSAFVLEVGRLLFGADTDAGSVFELLIAQGVPLDAGEHTIDAVAADPGDAEHLEVAVGAPLLRVRRRTLSAAGVVLECADDRYRPDRAALTIHNSRAIQSSRSHARPRPFVARSIAPEGRP